MGRVNVLIVRHLLGLNKALNISLYRFSWIHRKYKETATCLQRQQMIKYIPMLICHLR